MLNAFCINIILQRLPMLFDQPAANCNVAAMIIVSLQQSYMLSNPSYSLSATVLYAVINLHQLQCDVSNNVTKNQCFSRQIPCCISYQVH